MRFLLFCTLFIILALCIFVFVLSLPASQPLQQMQVVVRAQFLSSSTMGGGQRICLLLEVLLDVVRYLAA